MGRYILYYKLFKLGMKLLKEHQRRTKGETKNEKKEINSDFLKKIAETVKQVMEDE